MTHAGNCDLRMEVQNAQCTCGAEAGWIDATLCKLSDAKAGDVLVIRADDISEAWRLSRQLTSVRLPAGALPAGGVPVVVCRSGVEWTLECKESK